jgi:putative SOS response-associated peptidase YedK
MCGRATLTCSPDDLRDALGLEVVPPMPPRYNVAPTQPIAVVRAPRTLELLRWGLVPPFAHAPGEGGVHVNARGETVHSNPTFRHAFAKQRCLVVVDGFYEWKPEGTAFVGPRGGKRKPHKQPFHIRREDGKPFALAGIWEKWIAPDGEVIESCAIVTCDARGAVAPLHDRMPVLLEKGAYETWLHGSPEVARALLEPRDPHLVAVPVGTAVNDARFDDPRCLEPDEGPAQRSLLR